MKDVSATVAEKTLYLPEIVAHVREEVRTRKAHANHRALERKAAAHTPRGFARALRPPTDSGLHAQPRMIAELKKASPSKGLIRASFDVEELALELEQSGATALSVLTEERFFQGSLRNLELASASVTIPCLRKDFTVDPFQMLEARASRADAVLLIVAALTDGELYTLREAARELALDVLCEVHNHEELERALALDCECFGVNSRDLHTFEVSLDRACELAATLPPDAVRVAESGIHTATDVLRLREAGFDACLVGESLMRQARPGAALRQLLGTA